MQSTKLAEKEPNSLYERMMDDITNGILVGGERLKVVKLAERYGVSTSPVREVLRQLQGEGFVEFSPNRGASVTKASSVTITEIFELLQLLEPYFVSWFAQDVSSAELNELKKILTRLNKTPVKKRAEYARIDAEFHGFMYSRHYNKRAVEVWMKQRRALNVFSLSLPIEPIREKAIKKEHAALLDALKQHDSAAAVGVITQHIAGSGEHMTRQMRRQGVE